MRQPRNDRVIDKKRPMALSDRVVVVVETVVNHEALVMSYKLSTLLTTHILFETSQGLLNGSHGDYELVNYDELSIHV